MWIQISTLTLGYLNPDSENPALFSCLLFPSSPFLRSLVSSSRVLFLAAPHWALGKPVKEVVIPEQGEYLPRWVTGVTVGTTGTFDVVVSVEKYLTLLFKPLHDYLRNNNSF